MARRTLSGPQWPRRLRWLIFFQHLLLDGADRLHPRPESDAARKRALQAGPAPFTHGGWVRLFSFEPTLPAYQPYYIHAVGHFQRLQRPIRLAVVSSATESAMAALEARGYYFCMIGRTEQLVERWM